MCRSQRQTSQRRILGRSLLICLYKIISHKTSVSQCRNISPFLSRASESKFVKMSSKASLSLPTPLPLSMDEHNCDTSSFCRLRSSSIAFMFSAEVLSRIPKPLTSNWSLQVVPDLATVFLSALVMRVLQSVKYVRLRSLSRFCLWCLFYVSCIS